MAKIWRISYLKKKKKLDKKRDQFFLFIMWFLVLEFVRWVGEEYL